MGGKELCVSQSEKNEKNLKERIALLATVDSSHLRKVANYWRCPDTNSNELGSTPGAIDCTLLSMQSLAS